MNNQDYEILVDLYELKNITRTAEKHYISQSAMTKRIRNIEVEMGCPLILRLKKGIRFTPEGEEMVKYCRELARTDREMRLAVGKMSGMPSGTLNLGSSLIPARYLLPEILTTYRRLLPLADVNVFTGKSKVVFKMLKSREIDLAFLSGEHDWDEESMLLLSEPMCLIVGSSNAGKPLNDYPHISHHLEVAEIQNISRWEEENRIVPDRKLWIDDMESCQSLVEAGLGWAIVPRICLGNFQGQITPITFRDGSPIMRNTYVLYRKNSSESQIFEVMLDILGEYSERDMNA